VPQGLSVRPLRTALETAFGSRATFAKSASDVASEPGAYILAIAIDRPLTLAAGRFAGAQLSPGWYLYAGSAKGPGGIRARVARHMRADKRPHWHIDHVTPCAQRLLAVGFSAGHECDLVEKLRAVPSFTVPIPGFGSSDCASCASHFLRWDRSIRA
jgi:histidyl-tRNA synthetase